MKKTASLLSAALIAATSLLCAAPQLPCPAVTAADQVKIMPIGDSITFGLGEDGGYRKYLDQALKSQGIEFDMVGPEGSNSASFNYNGQACQYDDNHAGYSGYTIKQQYPIPSWGENGLLEKLQNKNAIGNGKPDIVLLIIGTNDMTANRNLNDCEKDLHTLIDYILADMPENGVIFMGSIPEFTAYGGSPERVGGYNSTVQKVAESYGDNVRFADVHGALNGMADMSSDNLHPSGAGYEKMGKFWAEVVSDYLSGQTSEPQEPEEHPEDGENVLMHCGFENGLAGWKARGGASVAVSKTEADTGKQSAAVTNRDSAWHGISYDIGSLCPAGSTINVSVRLKQNSGSAVKFKLSMQYGSGNSAEYDTFAEDSIASGEWTGLGAAQYTVKSGSDPVLYIETDKDTCDFYVDEIIVTKVEGSAPQPSGDFKKGDADHSGTVNKGDADAILDFLKGDNSNAFADTSDLDGDGTVTAKDLTLLKQILLKPAEPEPEHMSGKEYMASIRSQITTNVPAAAMGKAEGTLEHITYFSKKANRNKGANVWLPPGYDKSKQYPVFYVNHGYGGDEGSMVSGMGVLEIATSLIKSGEAEPMIIVFTNQYTDPAHEKQTGNGQADVPGYDNFVEDLPDSLMPYLEEHYPVKTGRENTAVAGFSMGGRESLYIGMKCCDKVGYIGAGAPAPGIFPTKDQFMDHPGVMSKEEMRIDAPYEPYVLMIAGGTSDNMVNDYPETYSKLFTEHGTENIFISVPGGGHDSKTVTPLMYNFIRCLFKA